MANNRNYPSHGTRAGAEDLKRAAGIKPSEAINYLALLTGVRKERTTGDTSLKKSWLDNDARNLEPGYYQLGKRTDAPNPEKPGAYISGPPQVVLVDERGAVTLSSKDAFIASKPPVQEWDNKNPGRYKPAQRQSIASMASDIAAARTAEPVKTASKAVAKEKEKALA